MQSGLNFSAGIRSFPTTVVPQQVETEIKRATHASRKLFDTIPFFLRDKVHCLLAQLHFTDVCSALLA